MTELSKRPNYRADIQGLRGVAVLLVVLFHAGLPVSGGFIGVDVFFVISGFVIAQGIVRGLEKETFSFRAFYVRRMRRLLPALTVTLSTVMALLLLLGPPVAHKVSGRTGVAAALFNANHYLLRGPGYFDASTEYNAFLHTWSLSVEEQFYFAFPLLLFILWRIGRAETGRERVIWGIGIGSALSLIVSLWLSYTPSVFGLNGQSLAFYTVLSRAWQFGVGALISLCALRLAKTPLANVHFVWVGLAMIIAGSLLFDGATVFPGVAVLLPTFGAALVIAAGLRDEGASFAARALRSRGMVRLGDLSYSWYLWHWPLIVFAAATFPHVPLQASILAAVASLGVAVLNERYVEAPIRFRPKARQWPALVMLFVCVVTPILVWANVQLGERSLLARAVDARSSPTLFQSAMRAQHEYQTIPCNGWETPNAPAANCQWSTKNYRRVHLIGDSNARHWIPVLRELVPSIGVGFSATTLSSCPFVNLTLVYNGRARDACRDWVDKSLDHLISDPPDLVLISNSTDGYVYGEQYEFLSPDLSKRSESEADKLEAYRMSIHEMVDRLRAAGSQVVVLAPIPKFSRSNYHHSRNGYASRRESALIYRCSLLALSVQPASCLIQRRLGGIEWKSSESVIAMHQQMAHEGVTVVDASDVLCPESYCSSFSIETGSINYFDSGHIAGDGARLASELIGDALIHVLDAK